MPRNQLIRKHHRYVNFLFMLIWDKCIVNYLTVESIIQYIFTYRLEFQKKAAYLCGMNLTATMNFWWWQLSNWVTG